MPARRRRTRGAEFKAQAVQACREPGMSMTAVAMAHGVNANLPRRWVTEQDDAATAAKRQQVSPQPAGEFVALQLPPPEAPARDIHIELQRGATMIKIGWPVQAAGDCAAWLREWLR